MPALYSLPRSGNPHPLNPLNPLNLLNPHARKGVSKGHVKNNFKKLLTRSSFRGIISHVADTAAVTKNKLKKL